MDKNTLGFGSKTYDFLKRYYESNGQSICNIKISGSIRIKSISKNNLSVGLKRKLIIEELTEEIN